MCRAKKIIVWIALLSVMIAIYVFSSQNADASDSLSEGLLSKILERVIDSFSEMEDGAKAELINQYNRLIRKCAHYSIYTLLGFVLSRLWKFYKSQDRAFWKVLLIGALYAVTDEIHQLFVPGRSGSIIDVLIDTAGVFTGIILFGIFNSIVLKLRSK